MTQKSHLDYRGLGIYLYWIVPHPFGKSVRPSITVGNSTYAAKHRVSAVAVTTDASASAADDLNYEAYTYNVGRTEAGLNLGIQLLKKFTLIPWANYESVDTSDATGKLSEVNAEYGRDERESYLEQDIELFWHAQAKLKYGIDFSIRLFDSVEVHVAGLLGSLASLGNKNDQIQDKTISLSIALDQKGN